jgi:hypothetical protein
MNNLSGEGLFDERPTTQMSLGRFVLQPPESHPYLLRKSKGPTSGAPTLN